MATAATSAAGIATARGVKAATAVSGAGAIASSNGDQVAASGSTLKSAEMVMSWAAAASRKAPRRQCLLLSRGLLGATALVTDALVADALAVAGC